MDCSHLLWASSEASVQARSACAPATVLGGLRQLAAGAGWFSFQHLGLFAHPASSRPLLKEHDNRAGDENRGVSANNDSHHQRKSKPVNYFSAKKEECKHGDKGQA